MILKKKKTDEITYENLYDQLKKDKKMSENREVQYNCLIGAFFSDQLNNLHAAKFIKDFLTWFNAKWENSGRSEKDFLTKDNQLSLKMQKFTPIVICYDNVYLFATPLKLNLPSVRW